jgi:hypothetical protein
MEGRSDSSSMPFFEGRVNNDIADCRSDGSDLCLYHVCPHKREQFSRVVVVRLWLRSHTLSTSAMATQENLPPLPDNLKFRVLIIGRANAGKTSILKRVCDTTESPETYSVDRSGFRKRVRTRP